MDDLSPFQPEESQEFGPSLDLTQPETEPGAEDQTDSLQLPPLPGAEPRRERPSTEEQLPELRFKDEGEQPGLLPKSDEGRAEGPREAEPGTLDEELPCERRYRDRNCCQEDDRCLRVIKAAQERMIQNISLDIAPPFDLDERGIPTDKDKQQKLAKVPSRTWMSQDDQILATGSLSDLRGKKVWVRTEDGNEQPIPLEALSRDDLCFLTAHWRLPTECPVPGDTRALRDFTMITFTWTASALCHKPLYFENVSLERYGHSAGPLRQPVLSAAHFFGSVILLPYNMKLYPPTECQYALGYYQPGDCAPWMIHAFPLSKRAALAELSFALGLWGFIAN
jgi:hypothetical protein